MRPLDDTRPGWRPVALDFYYSDGHQHLVIDVSFSSVSLVWRNITPLSGSVPPSHQVMLLLSGSMMTTVLG